MTKRPHRTPGETEAAQPADDLAEYDADSLSPADPVMVELAALRAKVAKLEAAKAPAAGAKPAQRALDAESQDEARRMCESMVAKGQRPRALLTPDGWYAHPEMARVPGSLGNIAPGAALVQ